MLTCDFHPHALTPRHGNDPDLLPIELMAEVVALADRVAALNQGLSADAQALLSAMRLHPATEELRSLVERARALLALHQQAQVIGGVR